MNFHLILVFFILNASIFQGFSYERPALLRRFGVFNEKLTQKTKTTDFEKYALTVLKNYQQKINQELKIQEEMRIKKMRLKIFRDHLMSRAGKTSVLKDLYSRF